MILSPPVVNCGAARYPRRTLPPPDESPQPALHPIATLLAPVRPPESPHPAYIPMKIFSYPVVEFLPA